MTKSEGTNTDFKKLSPGDLQKLVHELKVHQIELEIQNEDLCTAQKELEIARNKYSDLYDFAPIGYFIFDNNGLILEANLTGAKKLGIEKGNLIKKPFSLYIAPYHKDAFYSHLRQVFYTETQTTCELRLVNTKGHQLDALLEIMPMHDNDGNLLARIAMFDITQRKLAEYGLRESEARYRGLHESMADCFIQVAMSGEIVDVNRSYLEMLGYTEEEVKLRYKEITPAKWHEFEQKIIDTQIIARGYSDVYEKEYIKKDGTIFPVELRTYLLRNTDGKPFGMWTIIRDITERKQAEEARSVLASIVEYSQDAMIAKTLDGIILSWNPSAEKLYGYSKNEVLGKTVSILIPPEYYDEMPKILEKIKQGESIEHYEAVRLRKDGSLIDVAITVSPIKDIDGRITGASTIAHDITENKKIDMQLHEASLYSRNLIEASLDTLVTISPPGKITDANKAIELVTGFSRKRLIGSDFHDCFTEPEKARQCYQEAFKKGFEKDFPLAIKHVSGKVTDVICNAAVYKNEAGEVQGVFAAARDITGRKRAEEALKESEEMYSNIIEFSNDMIWTADLSGRFQFCNRHSEEISGYHLEERRNKVFFPLIMIEELPDLREIFSKVLKGQPQQYEATVKKRDGTALLLSINTAPIYSKGAMIGTVSFGRDITQLKIAEEDRLQFLVREKAALAEAQAARKLDQLKSMFIASTSHELKTPLNAIIGFSSLLLEGCSGELNPEQKLHLDIIHSAGKHLLLLISDVIDVSKIESGKIELQISEVELKQVVDQAVSTLGASIKEKGLGLSVKIDRLTLKTDNRRLLQCIFNLIGNAIKYTEKGIIKITAKTTGNRVDISVIDTGIGIKTEDLPKLFSPFVRLQTPLTKKTPGTGLGLYLVKKLAVDFLGGDVEVESEYGMGSKFTLNIPIELEKKG